MAFHSAALNPLGLFFPRWMESKPSPWPPTLCVICLIHISLQSPLFTLGKHTGLRSGPPASSSHIQTCAGLSWLPRTPFTPLHLDALPFLQGLKQGSSDSLLKVSTLTLQSTCHHTFNCMFTSFILLATNVLSICCVLGRQCSELWRIYW